MPIKREPVRQRVVCPGNGARYWIITGHNENGEPFVALPDFGRAATMEYRFDPHWTYIAEKLNLNQADATALAEIFAAESLAPLFDQ